MKRHLHTGIYITHCLARKQTENVEVVSSTRKTFWVSEIRDALNIAVRHLTGIFILQANWVMALSETEQNTSVFDTVSQVSDKATVLYDCSLTGYFLCD